MLPKPFILMSATSITPCSPMPQGSLNQTLLVYGLQELVVAHVDVVVVVDVVVGTCIPVGREVV